MKRKMLSLLLALLLAGALPAMAFGLTVTDMFGREVVLEGPVNRVVVMEPGDCEILCALGCEELLVGRGLYCDTPASVMDLPVVQSGADTNLEEILALEPQLVIMSDMAHTKEQVSLLDQNGVRVIVTNANSIAETYECIRLIGKAVGKDAQAEAIVDDMQATFDWIAQNSTQTDQTVYFEVMPLEWGLWSAGTNTFMHELAELCGIRNIFADVEGWQPISQEQVMERNPDHIVLVTGMGESAVAEVMGRPGWQDITAIRNGSVYNADSYTLTRPAPRLKDAALALYRFFSAQQ